MHAMLTTVGMAYFTGDRVTDRLLFEAVTPGCIELALT